MKINPQWYKGILGFLFLMIFSYNFFIANKLKYEPQGDAADFIELGASLAIFQKYGHLEIPGGIIKAFRESRFENEEFQFSGHSTWRPPVWPILIGIIFYFFGFNLSYLLLFKFFLHLFGSFLFFKTLKLLKIREVLVVTGTFFYGISPAWQLYSRVFLSEPITLFFITLWIYFLIRFVQNKENWGPQALVSGILILCHPYFIFLPFAVWFILYLLKNISVKTLFLSSITCIALVSVWIIRNFVVLETNEIVITTSSGAVMAKGWNREVPQRHTNTKGDLADETLVLEGFGKENRAGGNEVQNMLLYKDATLHFIRSNPDLILPITGKKLTSAFNPFPETPRPGILETGRWIFHILALFSLIYILFFSKNRLIKSLALGLILSTIMITIITYSGFRFRMPQVGLELLFIAYVVDDILWRNKKTFANKSS